MLLLWLSLCCLRLSQAVTVDTLYGQVRGHAVPVDNGVQTSTVDVFYGVPFGADTSGPNRFMRPQPPIPWEGILEADTMGPLCPQFPLITGGAEISEDCLQLNIYSPNATTEGQYPVMVYAFGGGFAGGSNVAFPGHFLASRGVVVVNLNYRTNVFGFATTQSAVIPGNAAMWDQRLALEFVRDNIANFGGDPSKVTMFGQSAGGCSTGLHIVSPQSKDLFHQGLLESGTETSIGVYLPPESRPQDQLRLVAADLDCNVTRDEDMLACLQELPWEYFYNRSLSTSFGFGTVYDGYMPPEESFLPASPRELRASGDVMSGPVIVGFNHDEGSLYMPTIIPETSFGCCNRTYFRYLLATRVLDMLTNPPDNVTRQNIYKALEFNYSPWPHLYDNYANRNAFIQMFTDNMFLVPFEELARQQQAVGPTYGYVYNYRGRNFTEAFPEWMGIPHLGELPYVWGTPLLPSNPAVREDAQMWEDAVGWTEEDVRHTLFLQELIVNFAKYGNPTPDPVDNPLGGSTVWPQYTESARYALVISNTTIEAEDGYRARDGAFWEEYLPYLSTERPGVFSDLFRPYPGSPLPVLTSPWVRDVLADLPVEEVDDLWSLIEDYEMY